MKAPVLLVAWRRPHTTLHVVNALRAYAPTRLYVACDGPSPERPEEIAKVGATRKLIEDSIDWQCEVYRLYSDRNQGCRAAVSKAITWFFENEEEGIILEDDCVPHEDFFQYCNTLLEYYREDSRIWCISGNNFQDGHLRGDGSYYFSFYPHCWGWASWRRCWKHYDGEMTHWPRLRDSGLLETVFRNPQERSYWIGIWDRLHKDNFPDSWAYRWTLSCIAMGGLTALPNRNLVSNIGFGPDATHTTDDRKTHLMQEGSSNWYHPTFVIVDREADSYTFYHYIAGKLLRYKSSLRGLLLDPVLAKIKTALFNPSHYPRKLFKKLFNLLGVDRRSL